MTQKFAWIRPGAAVLALTVAFALPACSDDDPIAPNDPPKMEDVAGTYVAAGDVGSFVLIDEDEETTDLLEAGAELEIELDSDGKTKGRLFVPEGDEDGSDFEADLAGTWTLEGDTVEFTHDADTFLRDTKFQIKGKELTGSFEGSDGVVKVTLVKS